MIVALGDLSYHGAHGGHLDGQGSHTAGEALQRAFTGQ